MEKINRIVMTSAIHWRIILLSVFILLNVCLVLPKNINLLKCPPPHFPRLGNYGPRQQEYLPGDTVFYYCNEGTFLAGDAMRFCMEHGDWSGDTPMCDAPENFASIEQSSTSELDYMNEASLAFDQNRETCSSTQFEPESLPTWTGRFNQPSEVLRVMLYLPKGRAAYEVFLEKADGSLVSCGQKYEQIETYNWMYHICLKLPIRNTDVVAIKMVSMNSNPLQICEVVVTAIYDPSCLDPHFLVESGNLILSRKRAELNCPRGYIKGPSRSITCIGSGVWTRKLLFCTNLADISENFPVALENIRESEERNQKEKREKLTRNGCVTEEM